MPFALFRDTQAIGGTLDAPTRDWIQRWRSDGLAGSETEARVMPGTANRVVDEQTFSERSTVMRARGADGKDVIATSREQDGVAIRVAEQHRTVGDIGDGNA
jgi:hypothetical protein